MQSSIKLAALGLAVAALSSCQGVPPAGAAPSSTNSDPARSNSGQSNPTNTTRPSDVKGG